MAISVGQPKPENKNLEQGLGPALEQFAAIMASGQVPTFEEPPAQPAPQKQVQFQEAPQEPEVQVQAPQVPTNLADFDRLALQWAQAQGLDTDEAGAEEPQEAAEPPTQAPPAQPDVLQLLQQQQQFQQQLLERMTQNQTQARQPTNAEVMQQQAAEMLTLGLDPKDPKDVFNFQQAQRNALLEQRILELQQVQAQTQAQAQQQQVVEYFKAHVPQGLPPAARDAAAQTAALLYNQGYQPEQVVAHIQAMYQPLLSQQRAAPASKAPSPAMRTNMDVMRVRGAGRPAQSTNPLKGLDISKLDALYAQIIH